MTLPLFDPIQLPPDHTLVDVNSLTPDAHREQYQGEALAAWVETVELEWDAVPEREWDENEGIFVVVENASGDVVGVAVVLDVEDA